MAITKKTSGTMSADGNSGEIIVTSTSDVDSTGFYLHLSGNFGGGTVKVQFYSDAGTWVDLGGGSFSSASDNLILIPDRTVVRLNVSSSTTPTIFWQVSGAASSTLEV